MAEKKNLMEEIQQIIVELGKAQQKTEAAQQKTEAAQQKTEAAQQKTEAALQDLKEHIRDFKLHVEEQGKKLSLSVDHINWRWGQFMENLAEKDLLELLCERSIRVDKILPNLLALDDDGYTRKAEYDLVAHNGEEIVVVEVKTTLFKIDIDAFISKLGRFRSYFPRWKNYKVYGAMIYMGEARNEIDKAVPYAESEGLLLIRCPKGSTGMAKIVNLVGFVPRLF